MKTFGLFMFIWLVSVIASFNIFSFVPASENLLKMVFATQIANIFYKLIKEEFNV